MEIFDLYTKDREKTEKTMLRGTPVPSGFYRVVVQVCIFNSDGQMLIQRRQPFKFGFSGYWDFSAAGSVVSGETSAQAASRELMEELGIAVSFENERPSLSYTFATGFCDTYCAEKDVALSELKLQPEEVAEAKWATEEEILAMIEDGTFIPYHPSLIELLFFRRTQTIIRTRPDDTLPSARK